MQGPFELEMKIHMTDGERLAVITYSLPVGKCLDKEGAREATNAALVKVYHELGKEWRLLTRHEFENAIISERYGGMTPEFATKETWDDGGLQ